MDLQILNTGDTPTFETHRGDRLCTSIVDVTACSISLLERIENWKVDRGLTTSDHNAITFSLRLEEKLAPVESFTTRKYNTKKANWSAFTILFKNMLTENNITLDRISQIVTRDALESILVTYTETIQKTCDEVIPRISVWKADAKLPWWTDALEQQKSDVLRLKRRIRVAAPSRRQYVVDTYLEAKQKYLDMAYEASTAHWKEFCSAQNKESMWDGIYRVIRRTAKRHEDMLLRDSAGVTLSPGKSAELLANTFYPDDDVSTDKPFHTQMRELVKDKNVKAINDLSEDDPPFTIAELETVLRGLKPKKAPGSDGLSSDICIMAIKCDRKLFIELANKCLSLTYFPKLWKKADVIILRKPNKEDYTHPKSYRPIGLLPVLGKIVEKLMVSRLQWHTLPTLNIQQYGFMPQRGTEDALYDLMTHVRSEIENKKIVLIISLDIEGAFDNAWWPALKQQLITRKCPRNLYSMVNSYLSDRKIRVNYARATSERDTTKGCVQGSIGGPTFWNIILDSLLQKLTNDGIYCQAFADDCVLVFSNHQGSAIEESANATLQTVVRWGKENKLNFAAHKTRAMLLTKKHKFDVPIIQMSGNRLDLVDEIKLLGLIIDRKLTFKPHVAAICKKSADIYKQLARAAKVTWGLNGEIIRTIYITVIEPMVTYAASAWFQASELQMNRTQLNSLQRSFAQKICKAYRTVSLTSALVLAGLLPLDLRIQEAANLYMAKKGLSIDYVPTGMRMEQQVNFRDLPHPSTITITDYELLEDTKPETLHKHTITGPHIYTDGSKIDGKVGAALTWWEGGKEIRYLTFSLAPSCSVFQSELYALHRAVEMIRSSKADKVNIMSDSRSSLDLLVNPKLTHPLSKNIKESIRDIRAEGRQVRLFWLRAHVGTAGNERADELAKVAAQEESSSTDYDEVPLSYIKRILREETVCKWQDRYATSSTGAVTKIFFPNVNTAYRIIRETRLTPRHVQIMTGHGGIAEYLHRFKLKDSPGCECDPSTNESVCHLILDCPRFSSARMDLEAQIDTNLSKPALQNLMQDANKRPYFLQYIETVVRIAAKRNSTLTGTTAELRQNNTTQHTSIQHMAIENTTQAPLLPQKIQAQKSAYIGIHHLLAHGEKGKPGIKIRSVALFMDSNSEKLGISYCIVQARKNIAISPGLACIMNGSTSRTSMRRKKYEALPELSVLHHSCRLVRLKNKVIVLLPCGENTPFVQACTILAALGEGEVTHNNFPRVISIDAMIVEHEKGRVGDRYGCIKASRYHEVVVYEDRGENLSFLKAPEHNDASAANPTDSWGHPVPCSDGMSGSERLQLKIAEAENKTHPAEKSQDRLKVFVGAFRTATQSLLTKTWLAADTNKLTTETKEPNKRPPATARTRADKGQVNPPKFIPATEPLHHAINAFLEFQAITRATREVNLATCHNIFLAFKRENQSLLKVRLEEAEAAIYDNERGIVLHGTISGRYMAAYSETGGFVALDEKETEIQGKLKFATPSNNPIVVVARCTKIVLDDRILEMATRIPEIETTLETWILPKITWVNGVPGCGKTTWVVKHFDADNDVIATTTTEAAKDLREKLAHHIGEETKTKVRTMASILVNGFRESDRCKRLTVDEALMNHFGAVVMAARLSGATEIVLIGDVNQLPYIDRENLFVLRYNRPNLVATINQELLCTHRNPLDVAYALSEVYSGIYSSSVSKLHSLQLKRYTGAQIPSKMPNTLFLVHTQDEKQSVISQGIGEGSASRVLTIHEAQGLTYETVVILRTRKEKLQLHDSIPHAVVAVSRHTVSCTYYTDDSNDAVGRFVTRAMNASSDRIIEYNLKMAMRSRDENIITNLLNRTSLAECSSDL